MSAETLEYFRGRWPDPEVPAGEAEYYLYEISRERDAVIRTVDLYSDGRVTRNSIDIEQRNGDHCPSLWDCSLADGFTDADLIEISQNEFEEYWRRGIDEPFWFAR
jgi:hypothetical protein